MHVARRHLSLFFTYLGVFWLCAVVMLFRFVTSSEIQSRKDFFEPFLFGQDDMTAIKVGQYRTLQHRIFTESVKMEGSPKLTRIDSDFTLFNTLTFGRVILWTFHFSFEDIMIL